MADDIVIQAEGLGKKYVIGHEAQGERYVALRDVIARGARNAWRMAADMAKGRIVVPGDTVEEFWALRDVNFEVKRGEVLGIVGRNGAGKSTLLKVLSRITEPSEGRITIKGRVASLLEVGTGFHPELTGRENIYLNGAILGMTRAEIKRKFDEIVAFAEVEKFLDTPVKRYSSGMYVRLAFAVAAHLEPEILIVDEVLAVGDAEFQKKCLGKMEQVSKVGRTILFVSHHMPMVESLCGRVILLECGGLKRQGLPGEILPIYLRAGGVGSSGIADLRAHPGRRNSREPALMRAWLETAERRTCNSVIMGQPVNFCFEFRCASPIRLPIFGFGVEDSMGRRIFSLNNLMIGNGANIPGDVTHGVARLHLPRNPLLPGTYYLSVNLIENLHTWVDWVEQSLSFIVEPSDIYGTGRIPQPSHGAVYVEGDILVEPLGATAIGEKLGAAVLKHG